MCNPSTQEREVGRSSATQTVQDQPELHKTLCQKTKTKLQDSGLGYGSVVELLLSTHKTKCVIPAIQKRQEGGEERRRKRAGKRGEVSQTNNCIISASTTSKA